MRADNGRLRFSPSDLTAYVECEHLTQLEVRVAHGELARPEHDDPQGDLIRGKGIAHEQAYLDALVAEGRDVVAIEVETEGEWDWERAARETEDAMRAGREVIYQAAFVDGAWRGLADFVVKGPGGYEAYDTKLARRGKPAHVLQLCFYSAQIGRVQGHDPEHMHVVLGTGETATYRPRDFAAYYRRVRARFLEATGTPRDTQPYPVAHCDLCDFKPLCDAWWDGRDHLVRVAGIRRDQIRRLGSAGIATLERLGDAPPATDVPRLHAATFEKLRSQAALQLGHRRTGLHAYELLVPEPERGLGLLPALSRGDLFFDIEGDPFWEPGRGLEYLFGVLDSDGFRAFWAHDRDEERRVFEAVVDLFHERLRKDPGLHVYHYAAYEPSALKRLMSDFGTREREVDDLLRREVLVDLYAVVRQGLRISHPRYSIKNVEQFYMRREAELRAGDDSILLYERWTTERDQRILDAIEAYNREDCVSTLRLRDWLLDRRVEAAASWGTTIPWRPPPELREPADDDREERDALRAQLLGREPLLAALLDYHRREAKPVWWAFFARLEKTADELVEDPEAIGALEWDGTEEEDGRSMLRGFTFPVQQHRFDPDDKALDPFTGRDTGTIVELEDDRLRLRRGPTAEARPLPRALIPGGPFDTRYQRGALLRLARSPDAYPALAGVLRREPPLGGARVQVATLGEMRELVERIEGRHLFVQGPPGSGKTYTGARLIVHLLNRGKRVGVAATSHKAIHHLLAHVESAGLTQRGLKKSSGPESQFRSVHIESESDIEPFLDPDVRLVAGTAWLFAREEMGRTLDYLVVDEAGQVALADALAMGTSARTLVLLGDPVQLAQVSQGRHPEGAGVSVLEHLLGDAGTIPEDRGLFLEHSYRMHPDVCGFVSDAFYEGRLESAPGCERQSTGAGTGLRFVPVPHEGNRGSSPEEAFAIRAEIDRLLGVEWTDKDGVTRPLGPGDLMVVAPYNEQVRLLREALPAGVPVGTVDKFQGQEAPVVLFSLTSSSGDEVPRNLEFLLSRNRLNVAVSRARCLAYVVASPRLLEVGCRSIDQMRMANALCRFVELSPSDGC
jgi:predicted RecB family nuclease